VEKWSLLEIVISAKLLIRQEKILIPLLILVIFKFSYLTERVLADSYRKLLFRFGDT
jgi:hypothetical protein